jgi:hypothetical protein
MLPTAHTADEKSENNVHPQEFLVTEDQTPWAI